MNTPTALLYEHEDGRYAVNPDTTGNPGWHRLGPVDVSALAHPASTPASYRADAHTGECYDEGCPGCAHAAESAEALTAADYEEVLAGHRRLVRELDVLLHGDGAAAQASLCDIVSQVRREGIKARAEAGAVPAGWKLVPVEPTPEMLAAGDRKTWVLPALDCWNAMLAASPAAPAPAGMVGLTDAEVNECKTAAHQACDENPLARWSDEFAFAITRSLAAKNGLPLAEKREVSAEERDTLAFARWQEQNRIGTHGPGCWAYGRAHYECALAEIEKVAAREREECAKVAEEPYEFTSAEASRIASAIRTRTPIPPAPRQACAHSRI